MVAVITGGSRGIGAAISEGLLNQGFNCIIAARTENDFIVSMKIEHPGKVDFVATDISKESSVDALVKFTEDKYGKIDLLVNDAGVAPKERKDILDITPDDFDFVMDINVRGTFFVTQKMTKLLIKNKASRIVNISSVSAYTASVNRAQYCISKSGISMITKLFAIRLADFGVSVLELRPGIIDTDMTSKVREKYVKMIEDGITPIKRMGTPEDVAKCVVSIAEGNFDFCTGTVIDVDGGFSVRSL